MNENLTSADLEGCPKGNDGLYEWSIDLGFDDSNLPECFDVPGLSGQDVISACSNCCPTLVDALVQDAGPFCAGATTSVCANFSAPFNANGDVSVNDIEAMAGESQICFDLILENNTCSFTEIEFSFDIICNIDQS